MVFFNPQTENLLPCNYHDLVQPAQWFTTVIYQAFLEADELVYQAPDLRSYKTVYFDSLGRLIALYHYDSSHRNTFTERRAYDRQGDLLQRYTSAYEACLKEVQTSKSKDKIHYQLQLQKKNSTRPSNWYQSHLTRIRKETNQLLECSPGGCTSYLFNEFGQLVEERYTDTEANQLYEHHIYEYEGKRLLQYSRSKINEELTRSTFKEIEIDCCGNWTQRIEHDEINNLYYIWERTIHY